ncbi:CG15147 [Drosophila busckii]|uniref:CG15147 n=1 Tax=Drosophila busckii TaxID=30019 RepID=A0A0M4E7E6_DROBS|nr:selenoprotein BthD [Drosophila busckii]ALC38677.1 CG15147 [Drosophila busckii]
MDRNPPPPPLDPAQPVLYIEHCRIINGYRQRAIELHVSLSEALKAMKPQMLLQLRLNDDGNPRPGSFEVAIAEHPTEAPCQRQLLWTGLTRVPTAAKVPQVDDLIAPACAALKLRYSRAGSSQLNLVRTSDPEINKILRKETRRSQSD